MMTKPQLRPCDLCKQDDETKCEECQSAPEYSHCKGESLEDRDDIFWGG